MVEGFYSCDHAAGIAAAGTSVGWVSEVVTIVAADPASSTSIVGWTSDILVSALICCCSIPSFLISVRCRLIGCSPPFESVTRTRFRSMSTSWSSSARREKGGRSEVSCIGDVSIRVRSMMSSSPERSRRPRSGIPRRSAASHRSLFTANVDALDELVFAGAVDVYAVGTFDGNEEARGEVGVGGT